MPTVITLAISKLQFCLNLSARDLIFAKQKSEEPNPFSLFGKQSRLSILNLAFCIPFPAQLYIPATLYVGYDYRNPSTFGLCYDTRIYSHYIKHGKQAVDIAETLARSLHDHSMIDALHDFLSLYDEHRVVAALGGTMSSRAMLGSRWHDV